VKYESVSEAELIRLFPEADFLFLEGFKHSMRPKIEVIRKENSRQSVCDPRTVIALAADSDVRIPGVRTFSMDDAEGIADFLIRRRENEHA
jgi:molybdopterin-guanine dinucleotide biosynthesis protein B